MCDVGDVVDPTGWGGDFFQPTSDAPGGLLNKGVAFARNLNIADRFGLDPVAKYFHPMVDSIFGIDSGNKEPVADFTQEEDYLRRGLASFDDWASQYTDEGKYKAKLDEQMATSNRRIGNQFGAIGLAGSSASIGAMGESDRLTQLEAWDRQLKDRGQIEQIRSLFNTGLTNIDIAKMNKQAADKAATQQQIGQILGAAGTVVGGIYGGPAGAAAGSQVGKVVPGQNYTPMGYQNMPTYDSGPQLGGYDGYDSFAGYGEKGNYWSNNPYAEGQRY